MHAGTDITEGALSDLWALDLEEMKSKNADLIEGGPYLANHNRARSGYDTGLRWDCVETSQAGGGTGLQARPGQPRTAR